ncbi:hypothetical protein HK097_004174, partial [Rhizophlyctis rosea]
MGRSSHRRHLSNLCLAWIVLSVLGVASPVPVTPPTTQTAVYKDFALIVPANNTLNASLNLGDLAIDSANDGTYYLSTTLLRGTHEFSLLNSQKTHPIPTQFTVNTTTPAIFRYDAPSKGLAWATRLEGEVELLETLPTNGGGVYFVGMARGNVRLPKPRVGWHPTTEAPNTTYHILLGYLPKTNGGFQWQKSIPILHAKNNTDTLPLAPWKVASAVTPEGDLIVAGSFWGKMSLEVDGEVKSFEAEPNKFGTFVVVFGIEIGDVLSYAPNFVKKESGGHVSLRRREEPQGPAQPQGANSKANTPSNPVAGNKNAEPAKPADKAAEPAKPADKPADKTPPAQQPRPSNPSTPAKTSPETTIEVTYVSSITYHACNETYILSTSSFTYTPKSKTASPLTNTILSIPSAITPTITSTTFTTIEVGAINVMGEGVKGVLGK